MKRNKGLYFLVFSFCYLVAAPGFGHAQTSQPTTQKAAAKPAPRVAKPAPRVAKPAPRVAKPAPRVAKPAKKTPVVSSLKPLGSLVLPRLDVALQRILDLQKLGIPIPPAARMGAMMVGMQLARLAPGVQKYQSNMIQNLPKVALELGLNINQPIGVTVWNRKRDMLAVVSISLQVPKVLKILKPLMQMRKASIVMTPAKGPVQTISARMPNGMTMPLALLTGDRLHVLLPRKLGKGGGQLNPRVMVPLLKKLHKAYGDPLAHALAGFSQELRQEVKKGEADLVVNFDQALMNQGPVPPQLQAFRSKASKFFGGLSLTLSLKNGIAIRNIIGWKGAMPWFLSVLTPSASATPWAKVLPSNLGWLGQFRINNDAAHKLYPKLKAKGWIPPKIAANIERRWNQMMAGVKREIGLDMNVLLKTWSGEWITGLVWDDKIVASLARKENPFQGNFRGPFMMFGCKNKAAAKMAVTMISRSIQNVFQNKKYKGPRPTIKPVSIEGFVGTSYQLMRSLPTVYILAYQNIILVTADSLTVKAFSDVRKGTRPSLEKGATPQLLAKLQQRPRLFMFLPHLLWDLVDTILPVNPATALIRKVAQRFGGLGLSSHMSQRAFYTSLSLVIAPKPVRTAAQAQARQKQIAAWKKTAKPKASMRNLMRASRNRPMLILLGATLLPMALTSPAAVGVAAAVAIPAFLRFQRKSKQSEPKMNLKMLKSGAISWFDAEHFNNMGDPMPKHFPAFGKGWICAPKAKPCSNGQPLIITNPSIWNATPWKQLKFSIRRNHYYQYCYKSEGTGTKAKFTIKAIGDLDCDRNYSTFTLKGSINSATGEVEASKIKATNPLE